MFTEHDHLCRVMGKGGVYVHGVGPLVHDADTSVCTKKDHKPNELSKAEICLKQVTPFHNMLRRHYKLPFPKHVLNADQNETLRDSGLLVETIRMQVKQLTDDFETMWAT